MTTDNSINHCDKHDNDSDSANKTLNNQTDFDSTSDANNDDTNLEDAGNDCLERRKIDDALKIFNQLEKSSSCPARYFPKLAEAYALQQDFRMDVLYLSKRLENCHGKDSEIEKIKTYIALGNAHFHMGEYAEAEDCFGKALACDDLTDSIPDNVEERKDLANLLSNNAKMRAQLDKLTQSFKEDEDCSGVLLHFFRFAYGFLLANDYDSAFHYIMRLFDDPDFFCYGSGAITPLTYWVSGQIMKEAIGDSKDIVSDDYDSAYEKSDQIPQPEIRIEFLKDYLDTCFSLNLSQNTHKVLLRLWTELKTAHVPLEQRREITKPAIEQLSSQGSDMPQLDKAFRLMLEHDTDDIAAASEHYDKMLVELCEFDDKEDLYCMEHPAHERIVALLAAPVCNEPSVVLRLGSYLCANADFLPTDLSAEALSRLLEICMQSPRTDGKVGRDAFNILNEYTKLVSLRDIPRPDLYALLNYDDLEAEQKINYWWAAIATDANAVDVEEMRKSISEYIHNEDSPSLFVDCLHYGEVLMALCPSEEIESEKNNLGEYTNVIMPALWAYRSKTGDYKSLAAKVLQIVEEKIAPKNGDKYVDASSYIICRYLCEMQMFDAASKYAKAIRSIVSEKESDFERVNNPLLLLKNKFPELQF